ncbi:MAG: aspartate carbamoyltransferase catalytic subunit [Fimbriimonadales bacterium]|nr:aspartate carbamoyltransferase catalytic subunit [Fimbriimonadales bacterium]
MPHLLSASDLPLPEMLLRTRAWEERLFGASGTGEAVFPSHSPFAIRPSPSVALLFYEPSTRTRAAFEQAAVTLGLHPLVIMAESASIQKGETLADTVRTLCAQGVAGLVIRHPEAGAPHAAARVASVPILNAGDGAHEHPTQAMLDLYTLWVHFGMPDPASRWLAGCKVAIVGDIAHSRVARSNLILLRQVGAEVWLCAPPTLLPTAPLPDATLTSCLQHALQDADVVMALRLQKERMEQGLLPSLNTYRREYQINTRSLACAKPDCVVMHPGPLNRGVEISDEVADSPRSLILRQVRAGLAARCACLEYALMKE